MSLSIMEDIKSVSDLKRNTRGIFEQIHSTGRPLIVTVNGKPDVVLIDVEVFEEKLKALSLGKLLTEAKDDMKRGRVRSARDFLKELKHSAKISC